MIKHIPDDYGRLLAHLYCDECKDEILEDVAFVFDSDTSTCFCRDCVDETYMDRLENSKCGSISIDEYQVNYWLDD